MKGIVITTDDKISISDFTAPFLESIRPVIGGGFEHVKPMGLKHPYCMIVNESGLLLGLPYNRVGSYFYGTRRHGSPIVGNIVIMMDGVGEDGPTIAGIPDNKIAALCQTWKIMFNLKGETNHDS